MSVVVRNSRSNLSPLDRSTEVLYLVSIHLRTRFEFVQNVNEKSKIIAMCTGLSAMRMKPKAVKISIELS